MLFTDRSLWTMAHGVVLGGAALMALAAAMFAPGVMRAPDRSVKLAIAATRHVGPAGMVQGIDPSPEMIARTSRKAAKAAAKATFPGRRQRSAPTRGRSSATRVVRRIVHQLIALIQARRAHVKLTSRRRVAEERSSRLGRGARICRFRVSHALEAAARMWPSTRASSLGCLPYKLFVGAANRSTLTSDGALSSTMSSNCPSNWLMLLAHR